MKGVVKCVVTPPKASTETAKRTIITLAFTIGWGDNMQDYCYCHCPPPPGPSRTQGKYRNCNKDSNHTCLNSLFVRGGGDNMHLRTKGRYSYCL